MRPPVFFVCTGAGAGIQQLVWKTPGCSKYLVGAAFPYSQVETDSFLGFAPKSYCSEDTAINLAMAAYMRAWTWPQKRAIGVAITASVASLTEHRGNHRIHGAVFSEDGCWTHTVNLSKGVGVDARRSDGRLADALALDLWEIAEERQTLASSRLPGWGNGAPNATARARELFFERPHFLPTGERTAEPPRGTLFPGAFNPPHRAHLETAQRVGATFWVDADHPHKPPLSIAELLQRARMLSGRDRYFTEACPLYIDKARRFEGRSFVIGTDALKRLLDAKWGPDVLPMLYEFSALGTRFLVIERDSDRTFDLLLDAGLPVQLQGMFETIGGGYDVSSTKLREAQGL